MKYALGMSDTEYLTDYGTVKLGTYARSLPRMASGRFDRSNAAARQFEDWLESEAKRAVNSSAPIPEIWGETKP